VARFESSIAANDMFPKLSIILTAVIAACVAVLSASASPKLLPSLGGAADERRDPFCSAWIHAGVRVCYG